MYMIAFKSTEGDITKELCSLIVYFIKRNYANNAIEQNWAKIKAGEICMLQFSKVVENGMQYTMIWHA